MGGVNTERTFSSAQRERWENEVVREPPGHDLYRKAKLKQKLWLKGITTGAGSKERFQKVQARTDPAQVELLVLLVELDLEDQS